MTKTPSQPQSWFFTTIDVIYELVEKPSSFALAPSTAIVKRVVWKNTKNDWASKPGQTTTIYRENFHLITRSLEEAVEKLQRIYNNTARAYLRDVEEYQKDVEYYLQQLKRHQKMYEDSRNKDAKQIVFGTSSVPTPAPYLSPFTGKAK